MENDEMVTVVGKSKPNNESSQGGDGAQSKRATKIKSEISNKEDEGIEIIEDKDEEEKQKNDIAEPPPTQSTPTQPLKQITKETKVDKENIETIQNIEQIKATKDVEEVDDDVMMTYDNDDQIENDVVTDAKKTTLSIGDNDDDDVEMAVDLSSPQDVKDQQIEEEIALENKKSTKRSRDPSISPPPPLSQNLPPQPEKQQQSQPNQPPTNSTTQKVENITNKNNILEPLLRSQSNNNLENKCEETTLNTNTTTTSQPTNNGKTSEKEECISDKENINEKDQQQPEIASKKIQTQSGAIKRTLSTQSEQSIDYSHPSKKHCETQGGSGKEITSKSAPTSPPPPTPVEDGGGLNYRPTTPPKYDPNVKEFLEKSVNDTPDDIKKHIVRIEEELKSLDELLREKEDEWNNMLHLKKVKEEILERLTRKKRINDIRTILTVDEFQPQHFGGNVSKHTAYDHLKDLQTMMPNVGAATLGGGGSSTTQTILQLRANMKPADLVKEKLNTQRLQRNILSKTSTVKTTSQQINPSLYPTASNAAEIADKHSTNSYYSPVLIPKKPSIHQQQQNEYLNGHHQSMGRQGAIKDVQSIIADFREKHPEQVPRRGRRLRPSFTMNDLTGEGGGTAGNSRPSSADSSHSNSNSVITSTPITHSQTGNNQSMGSGAMSQGIGGNQQNVSFKDVLVKFAKMTPTERQKLNAGNSSSLLASLNLSNTKSVTATPSYPEVTLHPLSAIHAEQHSASASGSSATGVGGSGATAVGSNSAGGSHTNSLLHGILTKVKYFFYYNSGLIAIY